jgi:hypothetical protein
MLLLSAPGTLRAILVLVIIWQVLRIYARIQADRRQQGASQQRPDGRAPGEVRIERVDPGGRTGTSSGPIVDADFEEIR